MGRKIRLDDKLYDADALSPKGRELLSALENATARISELSNLHAALVRAREGYTSDLKREVVKARSGVDIASLLSE